MSQSIAAVSLLVPDYDEAIAYYTGTLGFELVEDRPAGEGKRFVVVQPPGSGGARLVLARAAKPEQVARIGDQTGGRVFLFLETDDFHRDHAAYTARGVVFVEGPREVEFGTVGVFLDCYGNRWDLVGRRPTA